MLSLLLKNVLKAEGITNYRLSKDLDIDQAQLSRFFNGKGSISVKKLERIIGYLGYEITLNKIMRSENKKVKSKTPAQSRMPREGDYRYIVRCSKCNTTFELGEFEGRLTNERLQNTECPFCSKKGYVVLERPPRMFKINVEKKKKITRDKMERKKMELPFNDPYR